MPQEDFGEMGYRHLQILLWVERPDAHIFLYFVVICNCSCSPAGLSNLLSQLIEVFLSPLLHAPWRF